MGDQSDSQKTLQDSSRALSMTEIAEALPVTPSHLPPSAAYPTSPQQVQYQQTQTTYPQTQFQPSYQTPTTYSQNPVDAPQPYFAYPVSQQQLDVGQSGYQYGTQVGYQQMGPRPLQPGQSPQSYNIQPRYGYQQTYPQQLGRAMSIPNYTTSPQTRSNPQFVQQTSPYQMFSPSFLQSANPGVYPEDLSSVSPTDPESLLPRGPPRKPKQSGYALWVGNLPRDVQLEELKDFFAMEGLESIFLIRKSNCAFVNYKTEEICSIALQRFNDKLFKSVRLVCRLRRSSPTRTPSASVGPTSELSSLAASPTIPESDNTLEVPDISSESEIPASGSTPANARAKNRYFILKSLTKDDLAWSVSNKLWATQPHNESVLNEAFKTSENVYLIFSVNKSGEFFGYARMASEIYDSSSPEAATARQTRGEMTHSDPSVLLTGPKTTVTPRTGTAPRGKIFEDDVRGTVFWEVAESIASDDDEDDGDPKPDNEWGNPFQVEWIKWESPVQFQRTRLFRNPWNGNREVKISRDGTEIEPSVGARLLKEFDTEPIPVGSGLSPQSPGQRRMSYPMGPFRPLPATQVIYQQNPQIVPVQSMTYMQPYGQQQQAMLYNYSQQGRMQPSPQQYGQPGQQFNPYGQQPPHPPQQ